MNELLIFENPEFGSIRTLDIDGQPYWVAVDISMALGYKRTDEAVRRHCKHPVKQGVLTKTGEKQAYAIPESDLYRLIVHSKLPGAERFERWVFDEVLPTIRKTGEYSSQPKTDTNEVESIHQEIAELRQAIGELAEKNSEVYFPKQPKAFTRTSSKETFRKNYINYLLSILEQTLEIQRTEMLHQAYVTLQNDTKINLDFVKQEYMHNHNVLYVSMLDAICHHELAVRALIQILHYNVELIIND